MNQRSPLLNYRIACNKNDYVEEEQLSYDVASGLWVDNNGSPLVKKYVVSQDDVKIGETLITKTREGIDRSEVASNFNCLNFGQTIITTTRESIDRSENSTNNVFLMFQSTQTFTRESTDRSENS